MPYLPIDPKDLGRSYEAVIRVNSQSGKGGVAYLLKSDHALDLPRRLQIEFSGVVQAKTDAEGGEVTSDQIWRIFTDEYLPSEVAEDRWGRFELFATRTQSDLAGDVSLEISLRDGDERVEASGHGNGPIAAFLSIMRERGFEVSLYDYVEHTLSAGGDAQAAAYVELQVEGERLWGVGIDGDISTASLKAIVSCVNRAIRTRESAARARERLGRLSRRGIHRDVAPAQQRRHEEAQRAQERPEVRPEQADEVRRRRDHERADRGQAEEDGSRHVEPRAAPAARLRVPQPLAIGRRRPPRTHWRRGSRSNPARREPIPTRRACRCSPR